jgi:hypothetical protein
MGGGTKTGLVDDTGEDDDAAGRGDVVLIAINTCLGLNINDGVKIIACPDRCVTGCGITEIEFFVIKPE